MPDFESEGGCSDGIVWIQEDHTNPAIVSSLALFRRHELLVSCEESSSSFKLYQLPIMRSMYYLIN